MKEICNGILFTVGIFVVYFITHESNGMIRIVSMHGISNDIVPKSCSLFGVTTLEYYEARCECESILESRGAK